MQASAEATTVPEPSAQSVQLACNASLAASLLLLLKHQLIGAYSLTPERVAAYHPSDAERRKAEEQRPISRRDAKPGFHALHMHAAGNLSLMQEQYKVPIPRLGACSLKAVPAAPDAFAACALQTRASVLEESQVRFMMSAHIAANQSLGIHVCQGPQPSTRHMLRPSEVIFYMHFPPTWHYYCIAGKAATRAVPDAGVLRPVGGRLSRLWAGHSASRPPCWPAD